MFNYPVKDIASLQHEIRMQNKVLGKRGVYVCVLRISEKQALIYVFRRTALAGDLAQEGAGDFLRKYGYEEMNIGSCLSTLRKRLREAICFPHEIGLFLGYPLEDVIGFIRNDGRDCKACGTWKVYGDADKARQRFEQFKTCARICRYRYAQCRDMGKVTVSA